MNPTGCFVGQLFDATTFEEPGVGRVLLNIGGLPLLGYIMDGALLRRSIRRCLQFLCGASFASICRRYGGYMTAHIGLVFMMGSSAVHETTIAGQKGFDFLENMTLGFRHVSIGLCESVSLISPNLSQITDQQALCRKYAGSQLVAIESSHD
jgi:hypothetical protein